MMLIEQGGAAMTDAPVCGEKEEVPSRNLLNSIIEDFGGFSIAMGAAKTATSCAVKLFPNNAKYQKYAKMAEGALPVAMTIHKMAMTAKRYIKSKMKKDTPYVDEERFILSSMLDIDEKESCIESFRLSSGILSSVDEWLMTMPRTDVIETLGVLDSKFDVIEDRRDIDNLRTLYYMYRMKNGKQFFIQVEKDLFGERVVNRSMWMDIRISYPAVLLMCTYAYIDSLNFKDNIITIRGQDNVQTIPRKKIDHDVYQLPEDFLSEIKKSIEKGKKRGYALAGLPGTGKTTIVDKIIDEMRDVPVIYIPADPSKLPSNILHTLMTCQMVAPCIVVLEDIDSLPLSHKDSKYLNVFIEYLDSAKYDAPVIFLATMNEPENVHESLMDRRGRFDKVMVVAPPKSREHVLEVFQNIYRREMSVAMPDGLLSDEFYKLAAKSELRHSDFAEIIERVLINDMPISPESFMNVLDDICTTQQTVNRFKLRKKINVDEECDEESDEECYEESVYPLYGTKKCQRSGFIGYDSESECDSAAGDTVAVSCGVGV